MARAFGKPPAYFWVVGVILLLWGLAGLAAFYGQVTLDAKALAAMSDYDRALLTRLPRWLNIDYGIATIAEIGRAHV